MEGLEFSDSETGGLALSTVHVWKNSLHTIYLLVGCDMEWARPAAPTDLGPTTDPMAVLSASGPDADANDSDTGNNGEGPAPADGAAAADARAGQLAAANADANAVNAPVAAAAAPAPAISNPVSRYL
jgi:hypothetical protein